VGGSDGRKSSLKHAEQYDPFSDSWTALPDMRHARCSFGVGDLGGRLYAIGKSTYDSQILFYTVFSLVFLLSNKK